MSYSSLKESILDLERTGRLVRVTEEVDPYLEMAAIHRMVHAGGGPALFFERVKGSPFPAVSNLYGTKERARYLFRDTLERVKKLVRLKADPSVFLKNPFSYLDTPVTALRALPRRVKNAPVLSHQTSLSKLPQIQSWQKDGGAYILLPQVYTEHPDFPGIRESNLGMYRVQLSGNDYAADREVGLHYQIRRDIGIHHHAALRRKEPLRVSIFVGGPPAHAFAAVMYLPPGLSETFFAGALAGRRFRYLRREGWCLSGDADFCITGTVTAGETKDEGPFGDHLGYYSLRHPFPVMKVDRVYHRPDAIWPFTIVGRPPQEDSVFGSLIQEIAGPMLPVEIPGIKAVHAVDAAGVHPLLLAVGAERYVPYQKRKPQELLTLANAVLGYGPCSLAKYLIIVAGEDDPELDIHNIGAFFQHFLARVDWRRDLHFQTATTIDTLDYSGTGLNEGSKVVMAAAGTPIRTLAKSLPEKLKLNDGFSKPRMIMPGCAAIEGPRFEQYREGMLVDLLESLKESSIGESLPLIILTDDSEFMAASLENFLWVVFTRSNPSHDIYGAGEFMCHKHWGCSGPLVIDARIKPHHAPPLEEDTAVLERVKALGAPGKSLHGYL